MANSTNKDSFLKALQSKMAQPAQPKREVKPFTHCVMERRFWQGSSWEVVKFCYSEDEANAEMQKFVDRDHQRATAEGGTYDHRVGAEYMVYTRADYQKYFVK